MSCTHTQVYSWTSIDVRSLFVPALRKRQATFCGFLFFLDVPRFSTAGRMSGGVGRRGATTDDVVCDCLAFVVVSHDSAALPLRKDHDALRLNIHILPA